MNSRRENKKTTTIILSLLGLTLLFVIAAMTYHQQTHLGRPQEWSGYSLFALFIFLALFNIRKRLPFVQSLGQTYWWHQLHIILGLIAIPLYFIHVDSGWPEGGYQRWLSFFMILVFLSGLFGWFIQSLFPKRLSHNGSEIIFERIPDALDEIKQTTLIHVNSAVKDYQCEPILRLYQNFLDHYLSQPRYFLNNLLGGHQAEYEITNHFSVTKDFCKEHELQLLEKLEQLASQKALIDRQYVYQLLMKLWLLVHVPGVVGLLLLSLWHLLLVNIYAL